jgi:Kdo2-lipid IVA lauroyltransferase/acyltransferase
LLDGSPFDKLRPLLPKVGPMSEPPTPPTPLKEKLVVALLKATARLPLSLSRALGVLTGWISYHSNTMQAKVTLENLRLCYPPLSETEIRRLAKASLQETGKVMFETGAVWLRDYRWTEQKIVKVCNKALLDEALASGQGLIVLGPHLGNWEVLGLYLSMVTPIICLYQPPDMATLEPIIRTSRERGGLTVVPTNRKGVVALMRAMSEGRVTGILPDQVPDASGGEFAPFFGTPALTMTLVHNLYQRSQCRIIAGFAKRVAGGFEIHFLDSDPDIYSDDAVTALTGLNKTVENCVNCIPEQYQWEYKRFRKQPEGYPRRYRYKK